MQEIKAGLIKYLGPDVEVIEKKTIRQFFSGGGIQNWTTSGPPSEWSETEETNLRWSKSEGLVLTRVKYFVQDPPTN